MRHLVASLFIILGLAGAAQAFDSPKALIGAIYEPYLGGARHDSLEQFYSERLKELYAQNLEQQSVDATGEAIDPNAPDMLAFDPFIEGQNSLLLDLVIGEPVTNGDRSVVTVTFHNFDHTSLISVAMVREADGWKVDDIASLGGGENWLLSWLLQYDPFSVK